MQLEKYREVVNTLSNAQTTLVRFTDALLMLGFDNLAIKVERIHNIIGSAIALLQETVAEDADERFQAAKKASENMLAAGLAGVELGRRDR